MSKYRYEEQPRVIGEAVNGAIGLRNNRKTREANELLNEGHERVILEAMNEIRESALELDVVRFGFTKLACVEMKMKGSVTELVRKMFEYRA